MQLTKSEEVLMQHLWQLEKAFMKDILEAYPTPKPANTTIATLLKRMIDKNFVAYTEFGNSREYYPMVKKTDYSSKQVNSLVQNFFNNSEAQFASYFTKTSNLTDLELENLKKIIDNQLQNRKL